MHLSQKQLKNIFYCLFCIIAMGTYLPAFSQSQNQWNLTETLNTNNGGLPQNSCWDLFFDDKTGFLWISTEGGIVRYNGYDKKIFDLRNVKGMTSTRIGSFITSLDGKTFTYSRPGRSLLIENGEAKAFDTGIDLSIYGTVSAIDNLPRQLAGKKDRVLHLFSGMHLAREEDIKAVTWLNEEEAIAIAGDTCYYIRNGVAANRWPIGSYTFVQLVPSPEGAYIVLDNREWFWLSRAQQTLNKIAVPSVLSETGVRIYSRYSRNNNTPLALVGNRLYKLHCDANVVTATYFAQLPDITPQIVSRILINPNNQDIYVATTFNGLFIYKYSGFYTYRVENDQSLPNVSGGAGLNNVYGTLLLDSTHAYLGTNFLFDLENKTYHYQPGFENKNQLRLFWLGNDEMTSRFTPVYNIKTGKTRVNPEIAGATYFLRINDSLQWMAEKNISIYNGRTVRTVFRWDQFPAKVHQTYRGENRQYIDIIGETSDGKLMVNDGFNYMIVDTAKQAADIKFTRKEEASRIALMDEGRYCWVPTYGDGIYLYDVTTDSMYKAPLDINGYLLHAHTLAPDGRGNFLVPTNYGLFRINRKHLIDACTNGSKNLLYEYYDTKTGLVNIEFNGNCVPAYNTMNNGDILLPSLGGLVRVFVSSFPENFSYPVFIEHIKTATNVYALQNELRFSSDERTINWELNYAQWASRYSPTISYRLDDATEWTYLSPGEQTIQLIDLAGGNHTLHIKNQSDLLGEKYSSLTIPFSIAKKYYEKTSFWIFSFLLLAAIVVLVIYLGNKRLKQKNIELARKVEEKTRIVTDQNTELEQTLVGLNELVEQMEANSHFQKRLMSIIGHDFMVPLQYISKVSASLQAYKEKLSENTRDESVSEISTTSTSLVYLGQSIIQWIKLQENDFKLEADYFKLSETVQEIEMLHRQLAQQKSNRLEIEINDNLVLLYDPVAIKIILHNLLINANKFTSKGVITLKCFGDGDMLVILVSDTGIGMAPEVAARLNNMQAVMSTHGTGNESGWGLGYRLIIDLIKASHGTLSISSEKNEGTWVTITIPDVI
jgi:signal transduction histidine kinase